MSHLKSSVAAALQITAAAIFLTGCASLGMPATSVAKLRQLDPLDTDPAQLLIAVRSPDSMMLRDGDITLTLAFDTGDAETSLLRQYAAVLAPRTATPGITRTAFGSDRLTVAVLRDPDVADLRETQRRIKDLRAAGIAGKGSLSVTATGCRTAAIPDAPVRISTWLSAAPEPAFFQLADQVDLRKALAVGHGVAFTLPPC